MRCPDPEQIAHMMADEARGVWLDHAATCPPCRATAVVIGLVSDLTPAPAPALELTEALIDRYRLDGVLGHGAMGVVYAAHDPALDRAVAVKVLHATTETPARLQAEARALARLAHANVVRVYDVGEHHGRTFVAMEQVDGATLRQWLRQQHTVDEILAVVEQAGRGLAAAHRVGLVHRDFKPDNVLIADDGRVLVSDFGLARDVAPRAAGASASSASSASSAPHIAAATVTATGAAVGTPAYMAPEQLLGSATPASDQFGFCVTAWEALFGARPFAGATPAEFLASIRAGRIRVPDVHAVPRRVEDALRRGLAATPTARFPAMPDLLAALAAARRPRRPRLRILAVAAVVAMVAVVAVVALSRRARAVSPTACERDGAVVAAVWNPAVAAAIRRSAGPAVVAALDRYATAWRLERIEACRATHERHDLPVEVLATRAGCYDRARAGLGQAIEAIAAGTKSPDDALAALVRLDLCGRDAVTLVDDPVACGCPLSACVNHQCASVCRAGAFGIPSPVPGVNERGRQEAVAGISLDGDTLLYLAGERCALDHLFVARRRGDTFVPFDLTDQLLARGLAITELCCTLAPDARSIVMRTADRRGFVRLALAGEHLGPPEAAEFAALTPSMAPGHRVAMPVLSADQRQLYFTLGDFDERGEPGPRNGPHVAEWQAGRHQFGPGRLMLGRVRYYEYITGVSSDGLTLFMAAEFGTRVLVRSGLDQEFGSPGAAVVPARLSGWRAMPVAGCERIVTTATPGGCAGEDIVFLDAMP